SRRNSAKIERAVAVALGHARVFLHFLARFGHEEIHRPGYWLSVPLIYPGHLTLSLCHRTHHIYIFAPGTRNFTPGRFCSLSGNLLNVITTGMQVYIHFVSSCRNLGERKRTVLQRLTIDDNWMERHSSADA